MSGTSRLRRAEAVPWYLVAATFVILAALVGASIANYASVADAHARASLTVGSSVAYRELSPGGLLLNNGTVSFTILLRVDNPSSRSLSFFTLGYKIWLEDRPAEAGLPGLVRIPADVQVANASGNPSAFFNAFDGSVQTIPYPVPAHGNATFPYTLNLTRADPGRFAAIQNITQYAVNVSGGTSGIVWNVWVIVNLNIDGIPAPSSVSEAPYFAQISRIQFTEGVDFG